MDYFYGEPEEVAEGQGLVEYALILVLVALAVMILLITMGGGVTTIYSKITSTIISVSN